MLRRIRSWRPSHTTVAAYMALFMALGGTSYAAVKLPKNSVGATQIKTGGVGSSEVKNGALRKADFRASDLPVGPTGPQGSQGPQGPKGADGANGTNGTNGAPGPAGTAKAFARITANGALEGGPDQAKGITQSMIQHAAGASAAEVAGTGVYCIGGLGFDPTSVSVTTDNTDSMPAAPAVTGGSLNFISTSAIFKGEDLGYCDNAHGQVRVAIEQVSNAAAPALVNHGFFIWLEG